MLSDLLTVLFLLMFVFWGTKTGAAKMVLKILSLGASMALGLVLYRPISKALSGLGIVDGIAAKLSDNIDSIIHLPGVMRDVMTVTGATEELTRSVASAAVSAVSFFAVVVLIRVLIMLVSLVVGVASSLPVIKQTNGLLGGILGFALGTLTIFLVFGVMAVAEVFGGISLAEKAFDGSFLAVILYNNNPLLGLVL